MKTIKNNLKKQANELRKLKSKIRTGMKTNKPNVWEYQINLLNKKEQFRYEHIAYCLVRGRKYDEIEKKTRPENTIDMFKVEKFLKSMQEQLYKILKQQEKYDV